MLSNAIERAQKKIENNNFGIRKNLTEYDEVNNEQREIIYAERARVLNGESMRDSIIKMVQEVVERSVNSCISDDQLPEEWDMKELNEILLPIVPLEPITLTPEEKEKDTDKKPSIPLKHADKDNMATVEDKMKEE